ARGPGPGGRLVGSSMKRQAPGPHFAALDTLGVTQRRAAKLFNVNPRHIRRWRSGARRVPHAVGIVCNLLATGVVTIEQVEAAAPVHAKPEPPPPRPVELPPEQSLFTPPTPPPPATPTPPP